MSHKSESFSPVIIIGMHRSGTSMIAHMLSRLGLFMGDDLEVNHESKFFISCNDWLLHQCGGTWSTPVSTNWLVADSEIVSMGKEYFRYRLNHLPAHNYVGWRRFLRGDRPVPGLSRPWGWKDPRNTFTLPFWMHLFPHARVIHIYRNGVAVAASLRAKTHAQFAHNKYRHGRRLKCGLYRWVPKKGRFVASVRCLSLTGGFSLWEEYLDEAFRNIEQLKPSVFSLKYEDFLCDPSSWLRSLTSFCGLRAEPSEITAAAIDADRSNADRFMSDAEVSEFYECIKDSYWMKRLGYGNRAASMRI